MDSAQLLSRITDGSACRKRFIDSLSDKKKDLLLASDALDSAAASFDVVRDSWRALTTRCLRGMELAWLGNASTLDSASAELTRALAFGYEDSAAVLSDGLSTAALVAMRLRQLARARLWLLRLTSMPSAPGTWLRLAEVQFALGDQAFVHSLDVASRDPTTKTMALLLRARVAWMDFDFDMSKEILARAQSGSGHIDSVLLQAELDRIGRVQQDPTIAQQIQRHKRAFTGDAADGLECQGNGEPTSAQAMFYYLSQLADEGLREFGPASICERASLRSAPLGSVLDGLRISDTMEILLVAAKRWLTLQAPDSAFAQALACDSLAQLLGAPMMRLSAGAPLLEALRRMAENARAHGNRNELRGIVALSKPIHLGLESEERAWRKHPQTAEGIKNVADVIERRYQAIANLQLMADDRPRSSLELAYEDIVIREAGRSKDLRERSVANVRTAVESVLARGGSVLFFDYRTRNATSISSWLLRATGAVLTVRPTTNCQILQTVLSARERLETLHEDTVERRSARSARNEEAMSADPGCRRPAETADLAAAANLLLPPELAEPSPRGRELLIVPQGPLFELPFAALPSPSDPAEPLGVRFAIRIVPILSWAPASRKSSPLTQPLGNGIVMANPTMPEGFNPLSGAAREGREVARITHARLLVGSEATATQLRRSMGSAWLIHIASHGHAALESPDSSYIVLASEGSASGLFTVADLLHSDTLNVQLVVLSACQTGLGVTTESQGILGLASSFLIMKAPAVLVSLWDVPDDATEFLMRRFYHHWLRDTDHPGKADALRRAQVDTRAIARFHLPRNWAGFVLIGAN